jgi:hypothetical protein
MTTATTNILTELKQRVPLLQLIGNTPLLEIEPFSQVAREDPGQGRVAQPRRFHQGPPRDVHARTRH